MSTTFPGRVANSPFAEASIVGVAGGMAIGGYKPIAEIQFADYLWPGFMQMRNEIATVRWRSQGVWTCPVVVRIAVGGYIKGGPWHSACVEGFFAHVPGWYVVFPSSADDAKGLIKAAARAQDPVVFLEHKGLYRRIQAKAPEPDADYIVPFGRGRVRRTGTDVTIVAWGSTVYLALELARQMESEGRSLEVIDLRSIVPLDAEMVYASVQKTNHVVIAKGRHVDHGLRRGDRGPDHAELLFMARRAGHACRCAGFVCAGGTKPRARYPAVGPGPQGRRRTRPGVLMTPAPARSNARPILD